MTRRARGWRPSPSTAAAAVLTTTVATVATATTMVVGEGAGVGGGRAGGVGAPTSPPSRSAWRRLRRRRPCRWWCGQRRGRAKKRRRRARGRGEAHVLSRCTACMCPTPQSMAVPSATPSPAWRAPPPTRSSRRPPIRASFSTRAPASCCSCPRRCLRRASPPRPTPPPRARRRRPRLRPQRRRRRGRGRHPAGVVTLPPLAQAVTRGRRPAPPPQWPTARC
ncbi:hypothetical protein I4F81_010985 [Pyropia yezoensis]|uniref:Uncharacterized protein n=1 Tax=Pyropia yezoensis TaxID=2788 RepID=A0ACC3CEA2_PYRYE|nr:hypothetical protein I4F81_010985 [Neopyropia yezoensis]